MNENNELVAELANHCHGNKPVMRKTVEGANKFLI